MGGETVELDESQRSKAVDLLQQLEQGLIEKPEDVVGDWKYLSDHLDYSQLKIVEEHDLGCELDRQRERIRVSKIAGTTHSGVKVMEQRLEKILELLLAGDFRVETESPPKLEKFEGEYYVSVDGHHRVLAFKALELEELFVEYIEVELE